MKFLIGIEKNITYCDGEFNVAERAVAVPNRLVMWKKFIETFEVEFNYIELEDRSGGKEERKTTKNLRDN